MLVADGLDHALVSAEVLDEKGMLVSPLDPQASANLTFRIVSGGGQIGKRVERKHNFLIISSFASFVLRRLKNSNDFCLIFTLFLYISLIFYRK